MDATMLVRYNHAARRRLADFFVDEADFAVLAEDHGTSHHNIKDVFMHGCNMEDWWLHYIVPGREWDGPRYDGFTDAKSMRARVIDVEGKTDRFLKGLKPGDLSRRQDLSAAGAAVGALALEDLLVEIVSEDVHHRGEILAMLWRKDIEPPYLSFAEWAGARSR